MTTIQSDAVVTRDAMTAEHRLREAIDRKSLLVVGPGSGLVHKRVVAVLGASREVDERTHVVEFRWRATGPACDFFPKLDARLALTTIDGTTSLLSLSGSYLPPLGRVGVLVDRLLLRRAARSTMRTAVAALASTLTRDARRP